MVYEWDAKRARRAQLTKLGLGLFVALVIVMVPTWVAFTLDVI
ncbi:hypothetical protein ACFFP0_15325 [Rhizobium puerariae]|uniref:Uncharacterized protein n=1 Tax=Rhizobium puerariae TaxID=1585791 RepID=A0ABV6ALP4_9HYPH